MTTKETRHTGFWVACGMMVMLVGGILLVALPRFSYYFIDPPQDLAVAAGLKLTKNDRFIQFGRKRPSLTFYAQRKVYQINPGEDEKFTPHVNAEGRKMIVMQSHLRGRLPNPVRDYSVVVERNGFSLLASESLVK